MSLTKSFISWDTYSIIISYNEIKIVFLSLPEPLLALSSIKFQSSFATRLDIYTTNIIRHRQGERVLSQAWAADLTSWVDICSTSTRALKTFYRYAAAGKGISTGMSSGLQGKLSNIISPMECRLFFQCTQRHTRCNVCCIWDSSISVRAPTHLRCSRPSILIQWVSSSKLCCCYCSCCQLLLLRLIGNKNKPLKVVAV